MPSPRLELRTQTGYNTKTVCFPTVTFLKPCVVLSQRDVWGNKETDDDNYYIMIMIIILYMHVDGPG